MNKLEPGAQVKFSIVKYIRIYVKSRKKPAVCASYLLRPVFLQDLPESFDLTTPQILCTERGRAKIIERMPLNHRPGSKGGCYSKNADPFHLRTEGKVGKKVPDVPPRTVRRKINYPHKLHIG
ncbi:MAG: hypothetical protein WD200_04420 [Candidatus Andersenbacteria bacterium]